MSRDPLKPTHLSVHHRLVLTTTGCRHEHSAFCPNESRSVGLDRCRTCLWASHVDDERVDCFPGEPPGEHSRGSERSGADVPVGSVLGATHVAVRSEVTIRELRRLLAEEPANTVLVVDDEDHLIGTIDTSSLEQCPGGVPAILPMRAKHSILETATVADAVERLVRTHSRSVAVVDADGHAVGVLTDIDLLRWFARHRDE